MSKIKRKVFLKGKVYIHSQKGSIILCTKTSCNYTNKYFKGVTLQSDSFGIGYKASWLCMNFDLFEQESININEDD